MIENYSMEFQRLAHENGLRCTFESYTTMGQDLDNAMFTDEPMAEFWTPNGQGLDFQPTVKSMSSAAHLDGRAIVGAESFTSGNREKFMWTPAMIKSIGDNAFVGGVNQALCSIAMPHSPLPRASSPACRWGPLVACITSAPTPGGISHASLASNIWAAVSTILRQGTFVGDMLALQSEAKPAASLPGFETDRVRLRRGWSG